MRSPRSKRCSRSSGMSPGARRKPISSPPMVMAITVSQRSANRIVRSKPMPSTVDIPLLMRRRLVASPGSVSRLVDELVLGDPGHHAAELGADFLDRVLGAHAAHGLEAGLSRLALGDPVAGEAAGLDVGEDALHLLLGLVGDDARTARVVAILGGVGD